MLQLQDLNRRALARVSRDGFAYRGMAELETVANHAVARLRDERKRLATGWERLASQVERGLDTDESEYLDRASFPEDKKLAMIRWLHRQNLLLRSYQRFLRILSKPIADAVAHVGRPARLLELACGSGELTLALARLAGERGLPVELTGSDIVPGYVRDASARAEASRSPARFRVLNAFDLSSLRHGDVDVAFIVQSIHHFSPGQLAMMVAQVGAAGARHFVGIDGRRGFFLLAALPMLAGITLNRHFAHDAFISARRFYSEAELGLIASIAAPGARVTVKTDRPSLSVLSVEYGS